MAEKITDYPSALTMHGQDLLDKSNTNDGGSSYNQTESFTVDQLMTYINSNVENLYNADGSILVDRTITSDGTTTTWDGGNVALKSDGLTDNGLILFDSLNAFRGGFAYDVSLDTASLQLDNSSGAFFFANDDFIGISTVVQSGTEKLRVNGTSLFDGDLSISGTNRLKAGSVLEAATQSGFGSVGYTGHDLTTASLYFRSSGTAVTILNAAAGKEVEVRIGNVPKWNFNGSQFKGDATVGMKVGLFNEDYGLGVQSNLFEIIGKDVDSDYSFGYGTSGSLTELMRLKGTGVLNIPNMPTSSAGLSSGDLWSDSGVINIV